MFTATSSSKVELYEHETFRSAMYTGLERELAREHRQDALRAASHRRLLREVRQAKKSAVAAPSTPVIATDPWFRRLAHWAHAHRPVIHPRIVH